MKKEKKMTRKIITWMMKKNLTKEIRHRVEIDILNKDPLNNKMKVNSKMILKLKNNNKRKIRNKMKQEMKKKMLKMKVTEKMITAVI